MAKTNEEWNAIAQSLGFKDMAEVAEWLRTEGRKWGYKGDFDGKLGNKSLEVYRRWNTATKSKNWKVVKTNPKKVNSKKTNPKKVNLEETQLQLGNFFSNIGKMFHTIFFGNSNSNSNLLDNNKNQVENYNFYLYDKSPLNNAYILDNMYPFGYDEKGSSKFNKAGATAKVLAALLEMDPKRKAMNEFMELDLNNSEQYKRGRYLADTYFTNLDTLDLNRVQLVMRGRDDLTSMYAKRTPKWGMFKINPEYSSNTAKSNNVPTFVYSNEDLRRADLEQMAAYLANNPKPSRVKGNLLFFDVTNDPYLSKGNYTIVKELNPDKTTKQIRWYDNWDYELDDKYFPNHNIVITGDTIPTNVRPFKGKKTSIKWRSE